jgi:hypothetical protein
MVKRGYKNFFLGIFCLAIALTIIFFVAAAVPTLLKPVSFGNYSTTLNFTCNTTMENTTNATLLYNATGGNATVGLYSIANTTGANQSSFTFATVDISGLAEGSEYNFTCMMMNKSNYTVYATASNITIDRTPPRVTSLTILNATATYGNFSDKVILNVTVNDSVGNAMMAATDSVFFNITYPNGTQVNFSKSTQAGITWANNTVNLSKFADGYYTVTVYANDTLNNLNKTTSFQVYADSITPPAVTNFKNTVSKGNYSGIIVLNVSAVDANVESVSFNVTYTNGTPAGGSGNFSWATLQGAQSLALTYYNSTFNTSSVPDGNYSINVTANDTRNNKNTSESIIVTFDNTAPTITLTQDDDATTYDTIVFDITIVDATAGIGTVCTSSRSGASISDTDKTQKLTETGLSCASSYTYTITCYDLALNSNSASATYSTDVCGTTGTSSSSGGASTWTTSFFPTVAQVTTGYSASVSVNKQIKFSVTPTPSGTAYEYHYVGVKSVTSSSAIIRVASTPQEKTMSVGEIWKVDVTGDGYYDLSVKLNSVATGKADVTVTTIYEQVPATITTPSETNPITGQATGEESNTTDEGTTETSSSSTWVWVVVILVVAVVVWYIMSKKKRR